MADKRVGKITAFLLEMAAEAGQPVETSREDLIAEINGYLDELESLRIPRGRDEQPAAIADLPDDRLPGRLVETWDQLEARKKWKGVKSPQSFRSTGFGNK